MPTSMHIRHCFALDLKNDEHLISEYEAYHKAVWPEIVESIKGAGIEQLEIHRAGNRLLMIMEVNESFGFDAKQIADEKNGKVQAWETLMWKYQQALPFAQPGEKWVLMKKIFQL
jgi:L-rhamnose mutarotase